MEQSQDSLTECSSLSSAEKGDKATTNQQTASTSSVENLTELFLKCPVTVMSRVFDYLDVESFLACRLVCETWRALVNNYRPKWVRINQLIKASNGIHHEAKMGRTYCLPLVIRRKGFPVNQVDGNGMTPLHYAAEFGHAETAKVLISFGAHVDSLCCVILRVMPGRKRTPLHYAASGKHTKVAEVLILNGADVNVKDEWKKTPIHFAAENGTLELVQLLLDSGADVRGIGYGPWPNISKSHYSSNCSPLILALGNGHFEVAKLLISHGANVNFYANELPINTRFRVCELGLPTKLAPLHLAVCQGQVEVVKLLIAKGADVNFYEVDNERKPPRFVTYSPLHLAVYHRNSDDIINVLLDSGANLHSPAWDNLPIPQYTIPNRI